MTGPRKAHRLAFALAALVAVSVSLSCDRLQKSSIGKSGGRYDNDYVAALVSADQFAHAWLMQNLTTGKALMTRRMLKEQPDDAVSEFLVGSTNPAHAGFEITEGQRHTDGRIAFSLRLFLRYTGQIDDRVEVTTGPIILARDDNGRWAVDSLPMLDLGRRPPSGQDPPASPPR